MTTTPLRVIRRLLKQLEIRLERSRSGIASLPGRSNGLRSRIETLLANLQLDGPPAAYLAGHHQRIVETLELVPLGEGKARALELGSYLQMSAVLARVLDYSVVEGAYYAPDLGCHYKTIAIAGSPPFECRIHLFDAERHRFPFADGPSISSFAAN